MTATDVYVPVFNGEVHPAAAVWPMLSDDELHELAASIADVGQLEPIALDVGGRLVDGRNRLEACRIAGVNPIFVTITTDPVLYVIAKNANRRHTTTGARAMAAAVALADAGRRKNGRWQRGSVVANGDSSNSAWQAAMKEAGAVIDHNPSDAEAVIHGSMALDAAARKARAAKEASESYEAKRAALVAAAPDLAEKVTDEASLIEAEAALRARQAEDEKRFRLHVKFAQDAASAWGHLCALADRRFERQGEVLAALNDRDRSLLMEAVEVIKKGRA